MKRYLTLTLFSFTTFYYSAQIDYRTIKDSVCPPKGFCGFRDSSVLAEIYPRLLEIDTNTLSKGIVEYYDDMWEVQYELYARRHADTVFMRLSTESCMRGLYHDPKNFHFMWNAALGYNRMGECDKAVALMLSYGKYCPRRWWDKEQIGYFLQTCPSEEAKKKFRIKE